MENTTVSDARNITLVMDFYELTMSYDYFKKGKKDEVVYFDMFYRKNPDQGGYVLMAGHDGSYAANPPEGCDSIEDTLVTVNGLRILGLGGSQMYSRGPHQYTERQMQRRIQRLSLKIRRAGGVDIVLAHAPVRGYGDEDNITHRGFEAFIPLLDKYRPRYFIHGHVHKSYSAAAFERIRRYGDTLLINASERYILDTDLL